MLNKTPLEEFREKAQIKALPKNQSPHKSEYIKKPLTQTQKMTKILEGIYTIIEPWRAVEGPNEEGIVGYVEVKFPYRVEAAVNYCFREAIEGYRYVCKTSGGGISIKLHEEIYGIEEDRADWFRAAFDLLTSESKTKEKNEFFDYLIHILNSLKS